MAHNKQQILKILDYYFKLKEEVDEETYRHSVTIARYQLFQSLEEQLKTIVREELTWESTPLKSYNQHIDNG